jgi:hypothetical protein
MLRRFGVPACLSGILLALASTEARAQSEDPEAVTSFEAALGSVQDSKTQSPKPIQGQQSPVEGRGALDDKQEPAPRPGGTALDPKFPGFIQVPGTPILLKFNAKPRVDVTYDNRNSGNNARFVTATIPVSTDPAYGGGNQFNINAKASQLSFEARAPEIDGSPRFYFQNDFFGAGPGEFPFRVRHLYGEIYNVIVGMTYSVFEDPDVWPDTVDYEGPNSATFARRPLLRYMLPVHEEWQLNFGIEQPGAEIDGGTFDPNVTGVNHAPDLGANVRWEKEGFGHVQFAAIFRELGARGPVAGNQRTQGWGLNLSTAVKLTPVDSLQVQTTYGKGIFRYVNDDFVNNDASFNSNGRLKAIPYFGPMIGYTHRWSEDWRSTASYGYVHLWNEDAQAPTAYHKTQYASANVVWQIRKRLSLGLEGLYGWKEDNSGARGDVFRVQFGILYSLMD